MKLLESGLDVFGYRQMKKLAINAVCAGNFPQMNQMNVFKEASL